MWGILWNLCLEMLWDQMHKQKNLTEKALYLKELTKYMEAVCEGYIDEITVYTLLHMEHT